MTYQATLAASGGVPPYTWKASRLPSGLSLAADGIITGFPRATGTGKVTVTVTDAAKTARTATFTLRVPAALPSTCAGKACAQLSPDGKTVQVPASDITGVTRGSSGAVTQVTLSAITVATGDVLVLAAASGIPSGLIAIAGTVTSNGNGTSTVAVTPGNPADAWDAGTIQALPGASSGSAAAPASRGAGRPAGRQDDGDLECTDPDGDGDPSLDWTLAGLNVKPSFTPSLAAIWKHPFFGAGGVYVGSGGLSLFQFDLDGSITLNMGIAVSGAAKCTLDLPEVEYDVPAGDLGAVIFQAQPELTFTTSGEVDDRATVTLSCGTEYRWSDGTQSRVSYCIPSVSPFKLSADSGLQATLKGEMDASVTLDDIAGITGDIWAQLHGSYYPEQHPIAELDASAGFDLGACLGCFWPGSGLASVTLVSGTIFSKTLATYDTPPAPTPPVITTTTLPAATVGTAYSAQLTTADHRTGTWKITKGALPPGLSLSGYAISGTPTTAGAYTFTLSFTDLHGQTTTATATLTVASGGNAPVVGTAAQAPLPANAVSGFLDPVGLNAVSCPSASYCVAVGGYTDTSSGNDGLLLTWSGGTWTATQAPLPANAISPPSVWLNGVSCPSASSCVAVGQYMDTSGDYDGLLLTWSGGTWTATQALLPANGRPDSSVIGVSCPSASSCVAVGSYHTSPYGQVEGLLLTWSGGTWAVTQAPLPANAANDIPPDAVSQSATVTAVSCPSASSCTAVGVYEDTADVPHNVLLTWSGSAWTATQAPFTADNIDGISCPSDSYCVATNNGTSASDGSDLLTWSGGAWTPEVASLPANAASVLGLSGVSCPSPSYCVAVGSYVDSSNNQEGLLLTGSG